MIAAQYDGSAGTIRWTFDQDVELLDESLLAGLQITLEEEPGTWLSPAAAAGLGGPGDHLWTFYDSGEMGTGNPWRVVGLNTGMTPAVKGPQAGLLGPELP